MTKITDYKILIDAPEYLEDAVKYLIEKEGYTPQGGVSRAYSSRGSLYCQAMIKEEKEERV